MLKQDFNMSTINYLTQNRSRLTTVCKELIKIDMKMDDISLVKLTNLCRELSCIHSFTLHFFNLNKKIQTFTLTNVSLLHNYLWQFGLH